MAEVSDIYWHMEIGADRRLRHQAGSADEVGATGLAGSIGLAGGAGFAGRGAGFGL